jgi:hypothetical protein
MRIFILALGTRGDFEPFWSLAQALQSRGHHVTVGTSGFHIPPDPDLAWVQIGDGDKPSLLAILRGLSAEPDPVQRVMHYAQRWVLPQLASGHAAMAAAAATSDYFISNLKLRMPQGEATLPGAFVSYEPPSDLASLQVWGSDADGGMTMELVALNHGLFDDRVPADAGFHFTGFWSPPRRAGPPPQPPDVRVAAGELAPVVMTMGSMATFDDRRLVACLAEALDLADLQGIVVGGWSGCQWPAQAGSRLRCIDEADYEWLFPRALCVVHHGGSGTVGAVLRAGVPSVLLPQVAPQWVWAQVLDRAGLSAGSFHLRRAVDDAGLGHRARQWQRRVRQDAGVAGAVARIESHWHHLQVHQSPMP